VTLLRYVHNMYLGRGRVMGYGFQISVYQLGGLKSHGGMREYGYELVRGMPTGLGE
jgi:hypothetical protein